jgi:hypothetical protein
VIFSPVYSAILRLFLKGTVAKQPLPCMSEGLIASPWASFIFGYLSLKVRAIKSV